MYLLSLYSKTPLKVVPSWFLHMRDTTRKRHSFIGTDEYIQIIFIGFETDEYNFIFIGSIRQMTNVWVIRFNLDRPHIFVGDMAYIHRLTDEYIGHRATITGPPIFVN